MHTFVKATFPSYSHRYAAIIFSVFTTAHTSLLLNYTPVSVHCIETTIVVCRYQDTCLDPKITKLSFKKSRPDLLGALKSRENGIARPSKLWGLTSRDLTTWHQIKQRCTIIMVHGISGLYDLHLSVCIVFFVICAYYCIPS